MSNDTEYEGDRHHSGGDKHEDSLHSQQRATDKVDLVAGIVFILGAILSLAIVGFEVWPTAIGVALVGLFLIGRGLWKRI